MKNTHVELVCDHAQHPDEVDAVGTRRFSVDGVDYEIDLCPAHDVQMDMDLAPWQDCARIVKPSRSRKPKRSAAARQRSKTIRAWAAEHMPDVDLADKGRLPGHVVREYERQAA